MAKATKKEATTQEVRAWAKKSRKYGHRIGDRGLIPGDIIEAYNASHKVAYAGHSR